MPGSRPGHRIAVMPGDNTQRHVDARRDARRGDHIAVLNDVLILDHADSREQSSHLIQNTPVRSRPLAVSKPALPKSSDPVQTEVSVVT